LNLPVCQIAFVCQFTKRQSNHKTI